MAKTPQPALPQTSFAFSPRRPAPEESLSSSSPVACSSSHAECPCTRKVPICTEIAENNEITEVARHESWRADTAPVLQNAWRVGVSICRATPPFLGASASVISMISVQMRPDQPHGPRGDGENAATRSPSNIIRVFIKTTGGGGEPVIVLGRRVVLVSCQMPVHVDGPVLHRDHREKREHRGCSP